MAARLAHGGQLRWGFVLGVGVGDKRIVYGMCGELWYWAAGEQVCLLLGRHDGGCDAMTTTDGYI